MKRAAGIVLVVLALFGAWGVIKNWSKPDSARAFGRSSAYQSGRKAGKYTAPIIVMALGLGGLYLLKNSAGALENRPVVSVEAGKAWRKSKAGKIILFSAAGIFAVVVCLLALNVSARFFNRRPAGQRPLPPAFPNPGSASEGSPNGWISTGPYEVGTEVQARWAGAFIPGRITQIHAGGFNVMVKLDDPRFPHPILLSTNLLKPR